VFVELKSRAALAQTAVRTDVLAKHLPMERAIGVHLYVVAPEHGVDIQARMFAPLFGVPEDPATGGANVALIGLLAHLRPEPDLTLAKTIGQGFDMGRPSILKASAEKKAGAVTATYIGGHCVAMFQGTIDLS
jgi:trans-2,3-dihydro-3-hydroxyanthranilate isomerase